MRQGSRFGRPYLWLAGIAILVLAAFAISSVGAAWRTRSQSHVTPPTAMPAATPTSLPLHQNYVYLSDGVLLDRAPLTTQAHRGQTLSVTWTARAYNQSPDASPMTLTLLLYGASPMTLTLLLYGPFATQAVMAQVMGFNGGPRSTPVPVTQLPLTPIATAPAIHTNSWATSAQTATLKIPSSLPAGYYDVMSLTVYGTAVVDRGDSPLQIG